MKNCFILFGLIFFLQSLAAQSPTCHSKIETKLNSITDLNEPVDVLVILNEQADLSEASAMKSKPEKTWFVFNTLQKTAERTQERLRGFLKNEGVYYNSLFILNAIHVKATAKILCQIAEMPEVKFIANNPSFYNGLNPLQMETLGTPIDLRAGGVTWGIAKIGADQVWALGYKGQDVVIGGQDTGYQWDVAPNKSKYRGYDAGTDLADHNYNWHDAIHIVDTHNTGTNPCGLDLSVPCDDNAHGTHTMGTMIGGGDENADSIGVAPSAKWIGCRNMERGWGTPVTYIECFQWFLAPTDLSNSNPDIMLAPDVINNSWGCPTSEGCNTTAIAWMETVVSNVRAAGIVPVVSAGNSGPNCSTVTDPAAIYAQSFTIGASSSTDAIASFSSRGPVATDGSGRLKPDVVAPGVGVKSVVPGGTFASWNGTSMAGPHVAGVVALMISANPALAGNVDTITAILKETATTLTSAQSCGIYSGSEVPNAVFGYGRIDALAAVNRALTTVLDINLINFKVYKKSDFLEIEWKVENQDGVVDYTIQRSANGYVFEDVKIVDVDMNFGLATSYNKQDKPLNAGKYYYRLKTKYQGGKIDYSKMISVDFGAKNTFFQLFPNPFKDAIAIKLYNTNSYYYDLKLIDLAGKILVSQRIFTDPQETSISLTGLRNIPVGVYTLMIQNSLESQAVKCIKIID